MEDDLTITKEQTNGVKNNFSNNVIFIGFADNRVPEFKELKNKDWIMFGVDNLFPELLLYLYNKSSNHNAIINGKVTYILGKGIDSENLKSVNRHGENINKVLKKICTDTELFGGFYLEVIWNMSGVPEFIHLPFQTVRKAKDQAGYYYCKHWDWRKHKRADPTYMPPLDIERKFGSQIFAYKEYRPGCDAYPLPGYFGALNDIETDVEISIYNLSVMKNGQFSGKLISFFNGVPTDEEKRVLEKQWDRKFNGSGNAGKTMLAFNRGTDKEPNVADLSATDLDKLFDQLNKTVQAEIFSGHQVTSPMLFGIMEPGKLGGRNELQDAYEIFKNTYVNDKQQSLEEVLEFLLPLLGAAPQKLIPVEPISIKITDAMIEAVAPKEWILEKAGIDITKYPSAALPGTPQGPPLPVEVNENLKNLTAKQHQQVLRIVRDFSKGRIKKEMAIALLKNGYALGDSEIDSFLSFDSDYSENDVAEMFSEVGERKENFTIVKSKTKFESEEMEFADIKQTDSNILDLIRKDKRITSKIIGETLKLDPYYVESRIKHLETIGVITRTSNVVGVDTIIEHAINPEQIDTREKPETIDVYIKYSYEPKPGLKPIIETTRPFCRRLIELDRLYTRAEIEMITARVGFSVWDRKGGFWGSWEECRHQWVRQIVIKKK